MNKKTLDEKAIGYDMNDEGEFEKHVYKEEDIKEFIKKLKEDINNPSGWVNCSVNNINRIIDKRAGDKLTGEKEK